MNLWVDFDLKFDPILQGKDGQNKPENPQNWKMAKIAPKSEIKVKGAILEECLNYKSGLRILILTIFSSSNFFSLVFLL